MQIGKVPQEILEKAVLSRLGVRRDDVLIHARLGEDSSVIDFGDHCCVVSTDPITGAGANIGWIAVNVSCNDVAANGAEPVGVLATLLLPDGTTETTLEHIMADIHTAAVELGIEVLGGHSELSDGVTHPILSLTAIGRAPKANLVTSSGARPGDQVIVTKSIALEGTAILATDLADRLRLTIDADILAQAQRMLKQISVVPEGVISARNGATAMHDVTEGGIIGALYEIAEASSVGLEIEADRIPIAPETRAICAAFDADPFRLVSSGAMLITAPPESTVLTALTERGIPAAVIGRVTSGDRLLISNDRTETIIPPTRDELWRILESFA